MPTLLRACFGVVQFPSVRARLVCVGLIAAAGISLVFASKSRGADWLIASILLGLPALLSPIFWNAAGKSRAGELTVAAGALLLDGVSVVPARAIRGASIDAAFGNLRLDRRWPLGPVNVFFDSESDRVAVLRALGDKERANRIWLGSQVTARWYVAFLVLCAGMMGGGVLAVSIRGLPTWLSFVIAFVPAIVLFLWPSRATVRDGELEVRWLGWSRTTPLREIASVERRTMGEVHTLFITLRNGDVERVAGFTPYGLIELEAEIARGLDG